MSIISPCVNLCTSTIHYYILEGGVGKYVRRTSRMHMHIRKIWRGKEFVCIRTGILFSFQTNKFRFMAIISAAFCCHRKATSKRRRSSYRAWPLLYTVSQYRAVVVGGRIIICPPPIAIPNKLAGNMKRQRLPATSSSGWSLRTTVCTRQEDIFF